MASSIRSGMTQVLLLWMVSSILIVQSF